MVGLLAALSPRALTRYIIRAERPPMLAFQITSTLILATFFVSISTKPIVERQHAQGATELSSQPTIAVAGAAPQSCPVAQPPGKSFVPPSPYPTQSGPDGFWFGGEKLWVQLPTNGTWRHLPHYRPSDTAYRQKIQWWRRGYDWRTDNPSKLVVTGERLDSPAPRLVAQSNGSGVTGQAFIMSGLDIPTLGCWRITGDYAGDKLTFVILVAP